MGGRAPSHCWLLVVAMDGLPQFSYEMEGAWTLVDEYNAEEFLDDHGAQVILRLATRAPHHELPFAMSVLAGLVGCANGATLQVFPGTHVSPVSLVFLNVDLPQMRKSQISGAIGKISQACDERAAASLTVQANRGKQRVCWPRGLRGLRHRIAHHRTPKDVPFVDHPRHTPHTHTYTSALHLLPAL